MYTKFANTQEFYHHANVETLLIHMTESGLFTYAENCLILNNWLPGMPITAFVKDAKKIEQWFQFQQKTPFDYFLEQYHLRNITPLCLTGTLYPQLLKEIYQPPIILFAQGNLNLLATACLSVVGSREMSNYGYQVMAQLLPVLAKQLTIVSGLAKGVDVTAHQLTMAAGGKTMAVIGTGLANVYPRQHRQIQQQMGHTQLVISPLPLLADVKKWHFVYRNRVIAGLSRGTLVVEAAQRSGSLITANYALQENREVYSVPGPIMLKNTGGTNALIQAGAKLVSAPDDILEDYSNW